ncbi:Translation_elongation factor [Hexamita inflata]|uniref:Translation elongation factor n=1 Tax=Hexamita inflata TaxID=28002 RepID=A0AA86P1B1_9EUKA|nr:Translation elongation factor [Hexamita inflata]
MSKYSLSSFKGAPLQQNRQQAIVIQMETEETKKAKLEEENKKKQEAELNAKLEEENKKKQEAALNAKLEAENKKKQEAELNAKLEAENNAGQQDEENRQQEGKKRLEEEAKKVKQTKKSKRNIETKEQRQKRLEQWITDEETQREKMKDELKATKDAKPLSVIFTGHVDHGKSSMSGHILCNLGVIDDRQMQKLKQEASKAVGESWAYAFALDACQEEREKGKTVSSARATFQTPSGRRVVLLDSPGHKGFISSMIESAAQADVAVLVVSARKGEFEAGLEKSGQTAEHALILYISGIKNLIVAVNKMDDPTVQNDFGRFEQIRLALTTYLTKTVGFNDKNISFLPTSALVGDNLTTRVAPGHKLASWYNGPCLVELIDEIKIPKRDVGGFTRACVSGKYRDNGYFVVAKVEKGQIKKGDNYLMTPQFEECQVIAIEDEVGNQIERAYAGENCRIQIEEKIFSGVNDGQVMCDRTHPCEVSNKFVAKMLIVDCENVVSNGYSAIAHINTTTTPCKVTQVVGVFDPKTGKIDPKGSNFVKPGQNALIEFECENEICINKFALENFIGRVLLRHESMTVGVGSVVKVCYE